jgi:protein-disulfide isomerase
MSETIQIKKDTFYKGAIVVLAVLLIISIFTGGFGFGGTGAATRNNNAAAAGAGTTAAATTSAGDVTAITGNPTLFPQLGPSNAKATVIELADFQCPYCALASGLPNWTSQYTSQYGSLIGSAGNAEKAAQNGQIRFIFAPLSFLGQESVNAAQAAFCAENQDKFWQMHDAIYQASTGPTEDDGKYSISNLEKIAVGISGLDTAKFNSCLESNATLSEVQQVMSTVQNAGFQISTPQFWVNGQQVQPSWSSIQAAINAA